LLCFVDIAREIVRGIAEWFKNVIGLYGQGLDMRRELNDSHALAEECEALWGPRQSKNGFRLCHNNDLTIDARIQELWPLLYQKAKITNNSISLAFARGVVAKKKGHKGN
jgi:hypothetical protein